VSEEIRICAPELRGAALALGSCQDLEVCLEGPAGTGKTVGILFKIHLLLLRYAGAKALIARKRNTDLTGSALATYREHILDEREGIRYFGGNRVRPAAYEYPNGSLLIINGLDRPSKVRSWEFDVAFINEATECSVNDIEFVRSRLRHGKLPYHQLIMDCNPDAPGHWLNQRMNDGVTTRLISRHEDNPAYFDLHTNDWTEAGQAYIFGVLAGLTGVRLARNRYGIWAAAEGTVYEDSWDRARNVVERRPIPREWPRYLSVDFGFTNPFVCLWAALDPDGRIWIYRQIYHTKKLVEDHARDIALASGWFHLLPREHPRFKDSPADWADPLPREIIADHDAEGRATLERHLRMITTPAHKAISDGIQHVASRLRPAGDGKPRLVIVQGSLIERDQDLAKAKAPTCMEEEFESYVWDLSQGRKKGEQPVDADNHGMDALRYLVARFDAKPREIRYSNRVY